MSQEDTNIQMGTFVQVSEGVYKLDTDVSLSLGWYCIYCKKPSEHDIIAVYQCKEGSSGCFLLGYTWKRQRIYPVFELLETSGTFYVVTGETLRETQSLIENHTGIKVMVT